MTDWPTQYFDSIRLRCQCGHEWDDWLPQNVPSAVMVAAMRSYRCPICTAKGRKRSRIYLVMVKPPEADGE